jgi:hypothetical protein
MPRIVVPGGRQGDVVPVVRLQEIRRELDLLAGESWRQVRIQRVLALEDVDRRRHRRIRGQGLLHREENRAQLLQVQPDLFIRATVVSPYSVKFSVRTSFQRSLLEGRSIVRSAA